MIPTRELAKLIRYAIARTDRTLRLCLLLLVIAAPIWVWQQ